MIFEVDVEIDTDDVIFGLVKNLTREELLNFVKELDSYMCDWSFTEEIYQWVKGEHKIYKREIKEVY